MYQKLYAIAQCVRSPCSGYTAQVFGIQSHCRLRDLHAAAQLSCVASVIPSLPLLEVTMSLPKSPGFCSMTDSECVVANASLSVYAGQRYDNSRTLRHRLNRELFAMSRDLIFL